MTSSIGPSRRTLARGAAWSLPVLTVAAAAPATAASPCGSCPTIPGFQGSWSDASVTPAGATWGTGNSNKYGFVSPNYLTGAAGTYFGDSAEPTTTGQSISTTLSSVTLSAACSYVLSYPLSTWEGSQIAATLTILVGTQTVGTYTTAAGSGAGALGKSNAARSTSPFTVPTTGSYPITVRVSFPGPPASGQNAGDIWVGSMTLTCTGT